MKSRNWTFPVECYFIQKLQFIWNILARIVDVKPSKTKRDHTKFITNLDYVNGIVLTWSLFEDTQQLLSSLEVT